VNRQAMEENKQIQERSSSELLEVIETRIRDLAVLSPVEIRAFIKQLSQKYQETLHSELAKRAKSKQFFYIRHSQSTYNKWAKQSILNFSWTYKNEPENQNPLVTPEGYRMCEARVQQLDKDLPFDAELVVVSPLTRAIQTMNEVRKSVCFKNTKKIISTQLIRERLDTAGDIGKKASEISKDFPEVDFSYLSKESWWNYLEEDKIKRSKNGAEEYTPETEEDVKARIAIFFLWMLMRPENSVVFISHASFYRAIYSISKWRKGPKNTECHQITADAILSVLKAFL